MMPTVDWMLLRKFWARGPRVGEIKLVSSEAPVPRIFDLVNDRIHTEDRPMPSVEAAPD
jgi:hypothetical protein